MNPLVWIAVCWLVLVGMSAVAWIRHYRSRRAAGRQRHPSRHRRRPRPVHRGRRLPERVVAGLTDAQWPDLERRLLGGGLDDRVGEQIAREHDRNVAEMPEIDGGS